MPTVPPADPETRCRLIAEVTGAILERSSGLRFCEGLRLIEASARAVGRIAPEAEERFRSSTVPRLRATLLERFGITGPGPLS